MLKPSGKWYLEYAETMPSALYRIEKHIFSGRSALQRVDIFDTPYFGRCLVLDDSLQSAEFDEYIYHEALIHPAMVCHQEPKKVLVLGSGEGASLREILKYSSVEKLVAIDIDPEVVQICKEYLSSWHQGSYDHPKVEMHFLDARKYIEKTEEQFDIIFIDVTEPFNDGPSYLLFTDQFYKLVSKKLKPDGILGLQAGMFAPNQLKCHSAIYQTLRRTFAHVCSSYAFIPSFVNNWSYIFASQTVNVSNVDAETIDSRLEDAGVKGLKFYDGQTHKGLFSIPKNYRLIRDQETYVIEDAKPLFISY